MRLLRWLIGRTDAQKALERDALSYRELRADIEQLYRYADDFPQVAAVALWLLRSDDLRRWTEDRPPVLSTQWWGPPETFVGQLRARFKRRNHL